MIDRTCNDCLGRARPRSNGADRYVNGIGCIDGTNTAPHRDQRRHEDQPSALISTSSIQKATEPVIEQTGDKAFL